MRTINCSHMCFLCPAAKFFQTKADSITLAILKRQENLDTWVKWFYLRLKSRMGKYSISWVTTRPTKEKGRKYFWVSHTQVVSCVDFTAGENPIHAVHVVTFKCLLQINYCSHFLLTSCANLLIYPSLSYIHMHIHRQIHPQSTSPPFCKQLIISTQQHWKRIFCYIVKYESTILTNHKHQCAEEF